MAGGAKVKQLVVLSVLYLLVFIIAAVSLGGSSWITYKAKDPKAPLQEIAFGLKAYSELDINGTSYALTYSACYDTVIRGRTPDVYLDETGLIDRHCRSLQHAGDVALGFGVFAVLVIWTIIGLLIAMAFKKIKRMELARLSIMVLTLIAQMCFLLGALVFAAQAEMAVLSESFGWGYTLYIVCTVLLFMLIGLLILLDGSTEREAAEERMARQRALIRDAVPITAPPPPPSVAPIHMITGGLSAISNTGAPLASIPAAAAIRPAGPRVGEDFESTPA